MLGFSRVVERGEHNAATLLTVNRTGEGGAGKGVRDWEALVQLLVLLDSRRSLSCGRAAGRLRDCCEPVSCDGALPV